MNFEDTIGAWMFAAGFVVGVNFPKIKKRLEPLTKKVGKASQGAAGAVGSFFARKKEQAEDIIAKQRAPKRPKGRPRRARGKAGGAATATAG